MVGKTPIHKNNSKNITVKVVYVDGKVEEKEIMSRSIKPLQEIVEGYIEKHSLPNDECIIVNADANGVLPENKKGTDIFREICKSYGWDLKESFSYFYGNIIFIKKKDFAY